MINFGGHTKCFLRKKCKNGELVIGAVTTNKSKESQTLPDAFWWHTIASANFLLLTNASAFLSC